MSVRVGVVGGGLAGSLLAWRLARSGPSIRVDLVCGTRGDADATATSGGAVRGYETDPGQRRLAIASMVELLASGVLRRWSGYQETGSLYLRPVAAGAAASVAAEVVEINAALPGSASLVAGTELAALGAAEVPDTAVAVRERRSGHLSPARLRDSVLRDLLPRPQVSVLPVDLASLSPAGDSVAVGTVDGQRDRYDLVVLATGAWTPAVLKACGLPADGYRTKSIQYSLHPVGRWHPPQFVDELIGVYGRPAAGGRFLLGLPTDRWDVDPDQPVVLPGLPVVAAERARSRWPRLRLGPPGRGTSAADCYADEPGLALRPVPGGGRLFTFTGGAGGSVKTALAASANAAAALAGAGVG